MASLHIQKSVIPPSPRLPLEIIYMIAEFGSFELRVNLARCNRYLYRTCWPLIFEKITLYTSTQIFKLFHNPIAVAMLGTTKAILMSEDVLDYLEQILHLGGRSGVKELAKYFFALLTATTSLRRFDVFSLSSGFVYLGAVIARTAAKNVGQKTAYILPSSVHPFIALDEDFLGSNLADAHDTKPVVAYHMQSLGNYHMEIFLKRSNPGWCSYWDLPAKQAGRLIRQCIGALACARLQILNLTIGFKKDRADIQPASLPQFFSWIQDVLRVAGCSSIAVLLTNFGSTQPNWPLHLQHAALTELQRNIPSLLAFGSGVAWYHPGIGYVGHEGSPALTLSGWMPCPSNISKNPEVLGWWLDTLGINIFATHSLEDLEHIVERLQRVMSERTEKHHIPSKSELLMFLSAHQQNM